MENDYRVNIVSLEMDRGAEAEASVESTLSNSLESGITVESSRGDGNSKLVIETSVVYALFFFGFILSHERERERGRRLSGSRLILRFRR